MTELRAFKIYCQAVYRFLIASSVLLLSLTACSVPDYVYPTTWFESKKQKQEVSTAKPIPGKDKSYPKISSVPARPGPITIAQIRKELTEGLIADSANARYTDAIIRREPTMAPLRTIAVEGASQNEGKGGQAPSKVIVTKQPRSPKLETVPTLSVAEKIQKSAKAAPVIPSTARLQIAAVNEKKSNSVVESPTETTNSGASRKIRDASRLKNQKVPEVPLVNLARPATPLPQPKFSEEESSKSLQSGENEQLEQVAIIYFGNATSTLTNDDVYVLREVAALQLDTGGMVRVIGHSSRGVSGGNRLKQGLRNFKLSLDRANTVANALVRFGMDKKKIDVIARGDGQLLYAETTAAGVGGNRRVEVFLKNL